MNTQRNWLRGLVLVGTLAVLGVLGLIGLELVGLGGIGPNLGLSYGYYGRFNRVLARIEASPGVQVVDTTLHHDMELEDFYITVRMRDQRQVRLKFEEAHTRPFAELVAELKKAGI